MDKERLMVLLYNAISLLEERVFDNYESEAQYQIGMSDEEYKAVMGIDE